MNEVTSRGIHKPQELSVCFWVMSPPTRPEFGTFQHLGVLSRQEGERGWKWIKCRQGKQCECCPLSLGKDLLHGEDSRCSLKWACWYFNPLLVLRKDKLPWVEMHLSHLVALGKDPNWLRIYSLKHNKDRGSPGLWRCDEGPAVINIFPRDQIRNDNYLFL